MDDLEFYDRRYEGGYMDDWPAWKKDRVRDLIRGLGLPSCGRALDFGCGTGVFTDVLRAALPEWTVDGTDLSGVAIQQATRRRRGRFFTWPPQPESRAAYDLVFTHHVLEHVADLPTVWHELDALLRPDGRMLHVLPCGNVGSLEHYVATLRTDGIERGRGDCFFFDEDGHRRRLTTEALAHLGRETGYALAHESYANQRYGAIAWITRMPAGWVAAFADPRYGVTAAARRRLHALRVLLVGTRVLRIARMGPIAVLVDSYLQRKLEDEWRVARRDRAGSEMYLYFTKIDGGALPR